MKTDFLLSQYLYQTKKLMLPGIGTFTLDPSVTIAAETDKQRIPAQGLAFSNNFSQVLDPELIRFVQTNTGKMYPLAQADLESYVSLGHQFLNIGKPLFIEGIGTLVKLSSGLFEFVPGDFVTPRLEESRDPHRKSEFEETARVEQQSDTGRRMLLLILILASLAIIVWGAWFLYKQNTSVPSSKEAVVMDTLVNRPADTTKSYAPDSTLLQQDSVNMTAATKNSVTPDSLYRFVLETSPQKRALKRYAQLKSYFIPVKLETKDSTSYKIFMELKASPADTARMCDSLTRLYLRRVKVENHGQ